MKTERDINKQTRLIKYMLLILLTLLTFMGVTVVKGSVRVSAQNLTIIYNSQGGVAVPNKTITNGSAIGTLPTTTRSGYVYNGWKRADTGAWVTASTVFNGVAGRKYTVKSGDWPVKIVEDHMKLGVLSSNFDIAKATFLAANGWTVWPTLSVGQVLFITPDSLTFRLNAQWLVAETVTFNANGGTVSPTTKTVGVGTKIGTLPEPTRDGYSFNGWFTATSGGTQLTTETIIKSSKPKTHTIVTNNTWWGLATTYLGDGNLHPQIAAWNGMATGATLLPGKVLIVENPANVPKNIYYAQWTINRKVTFNPNGGGTPSTATKMVKSGTAVGTLATVSRTGHTFNGWFTATSGGTAITTSTVVSADVIYYAQWTALNYTFTFNANGGGTPSSATITKSYGTAVGTLPTVSRTGYTFAGWFTTSAATGGTQLATTTGITSNITYYARWTINTYTFTFNANGGGTPSSTSITRNYNTAVGTLPTVAYAGYTFNGWFTTTSGGTQLATTTLMTANTTYYAQWTINRTVTFNANGGNAPSFATKAVKSGTAIGTLPTISRTGHTFKGWYTATSAGTAITTGTIISANVIYYAQWTAINYTFTFNANGGGTPSSATITKPYGTAVGTLPTVSRTGYTFEGWFTATSGGTKLLTTTTVTSNVTYYAQWTINRTVTFNTNGGNTPSPASKEVKTGTAIGTLATVTRTGHTHLGWYTAASGGTAITTGTIISANVTYYAQWRSDTFTFTFNANGGGTPSSASITKNYNTDIGTLPTVSRTGYTFAGWWTTSAATGGTQLTTTTKVTTNVIYYARWTINTYTFTFNANGGGTPSSATITKDYNTAVGTLPTISRTGYTFGGWFNTASATGGTQLATSTLITSNVIYYARWTINSYTATFNTNGGNTPSPTTITKNYNIALGTLPTVTRTGHYFNGWFTLASGGSKISTATVVTANVTYYAQWLLNHTVTFNANGGNAPSFASKEVPNGHQFGTLPTISRTGHTFGGWWTATSAGTQLATTTVITANTIYYARWTANNFTVTFNANGGNAPSPTTITKAYGLQLGALPTTTRSGYTFNGWYTAASGGSKVATTTIMTGTTTYYAQWTINRTVTFNSNGGDAPSFASRVLTSGSAFGTLPTVSRTGYTFGGWWTTSAASGGTQLATSTIISADIIYYARWTINTYTFTFNANGGGTPSTASITKNYNTAVGTLPTTTRTMYTFGGWYNTANTSGGTLLTTSTLMTSNVTYYARWTANTYQVTYNANGGTGAPAVQSFVYNSGAKISTTVPTRAGYTFTHWLYNTTTFAPGAAIPTGWGSFGLTAQWVINTYTFTFNANGGGTPSSATISKNYGTTVGTLPTISRTGYTFRGWFTTSAATGGTQLTTSTVVSSNVTYYARWDINYTVTFNANGGNTPSESSRIVANGDKVGTLPTTTRTGYTFNGWYTAASSGTEVTSNTLVTSTVTYYAQWTIVNYTVTWDGNGGTTPAVTKKDYNTTIGTLPTTTRVGYRFDGWWSTVALSGGTQITTTTIVTNNVTYYARWTILSYMVNFNANGGNAIASKSYDHNMQLGTLPVPVRVGYTNTGWFTLSTGGTKIATTTLVTGNITYYAQWTINSYTATFDGNGGSNGVAITKTYNSTLGTLPTSTRDGHYFNGWYTAKTGGTTVSTTTMLTANVTYYAQWLVNQTVTFNANGGNTPSETTRVVPNGHQLGDLPTVTRTGYTNTGWFTAASGGTAVSKTTVVTTNISYFAQWSINTYTFTFNANGGGTPSQASITKNYNTAVGTLPTISRTGYTFGGWFNTANASGGSQLATSTLMTSNVTYYARWTINKYTVNFNSNGGSLVASSEHNFNTQVGTLPTTIRDGHTFLGWYTALTGGSKIANTTVVTNNVTYYAQWSINTYTAKFDGNGGSNGSDITKTYDSELGALPVTTRTGHYFNGWFTATTGGTKISTTTRLTANVTYYAQWLVEQTVTFNSNGGNTPSITSKVVPNGHQLGDLPTVTRTGYTYTGWFTAASGGTSVSKTTVITTNVTYYAQWTINTYTYTFNANGGGTPSQTSITKDYNTAVGTLPTISRTGYTFNGWFNTANASGGTQLATSTLMISNVTYYARWTINNYTVNFNSNGGSLVASKDYNYNLTLGTLPTSTRTGYTFLGWYTALTGGSQIATTTVVTNNVTYYAQWGINSYTVNFNGNGGTNGASITTAYDTEIGAIPTSTRVGHYFNGWYTSQTGGTQISATTKVTESVTYYAQWLVNRTVIFNANGGNAPSFASKVVPNGHQFGDLPTISRTGHTHTGWFTTTSGGTKLDKTTVITTDITYYAQWNANNYTATFNTNGGDTATPATITKLYNTEIGTLPTTTREGHYFNGWFTATTGGTKISTTTKLVTNVTYYAQWLVNRTVTFNANGGNTPSIASKIVPNGHQFGTLPTVTRTGHDFNGWFTATTGGTQLATNTVITTDITYYAQWTIHEFTVVWDGKGGTSPTSKIVSYNSTVGTLPVTTRTGYTFLGWYTDTTGGTKVTTSTVITKNITFYAQWVINRTVTFNTHGGTTVATQTVTNGTVLTTLPTTTRTGYTFNGWYTAHTGGSKVDAPLTVNVDTVLNAQWTLNNYTVTFNSNGGSTVASVGYPYNNQLGTLPTPTRTGYTLNGWYTATTGGTKVDASTRVTNNITYYAQWSINTYTATFDGNGGSNGASISKVYNTTIGTLPTSTRVGYTFNGWYTSRTGGTKVETNTLVLKDITYYAQWTAINYTITYDSQGGTVAGVVVRAYDTEVGTLPEPTRVGYHFEGWITSTNGTGTKVTTSTRIYGNTTFYAYWIVNRTVTFDVNGGTVVTPNTRVVVNNRVIGNLPTTTRVGHNFNGWFTTKTGGTVVTATTIVTADTTYFAQWTPINYAVTFDVQGGSEVSVVTKAYDTVIGALPVTTKSGHHFEGWFTAANGGGSKVTTSTRIYGNTTFYAYWIVNRTVTFDSNGGEVVSPTTRVVINNRVVGTLPTTTRVGHTLNGWFTTRTGTVQVTKDTIVTADTTYYAQWTAINYTVIFDVQGGSVVNSVVKSYNTTIGTLPTTTKTGHHFEGWYTAINGGGSKVATTTRIYGNTTYYAYWIVNRTVTFNSNGGTTPEPVTKTIVHGRAVGELPEVTRVGHTFDGWFTTRTNTTKVTTTTIVTEDVTYYAQWTAINYTVTFDVQGGTTVQSETRAYNTTIGTLPTTTKAGHHFEDWFTAINGTGSRVTTSTRVYGDVTYFAYWIVNRTVTFNANGGDTPSQTSKVIVHNREVGTLPTTTRVGYIFSGWFTSRTGGTKLTTTTLITSDVTYYAQWTAINYTVTFDVQGGSAVNSQVVAYDTAIGTLPVTTKSGHHFEGWYTSTNGGGSKVTTSTRIYGNTTYYAYWIVNRTVTFNSNGGTTATPASKIVVHNRAVGTLPTTTRTGYTFNGWFTTRTGGTKLETTTLITSDITYYAQWTPIMYTITWDVQGGVAVTNEQKAYDSMIGTLPTTTRTGYTFLGWYTGVNGTGSSITTRTVVKGNATYYANWVINRTLEYNSQGGSSINSVVVTDGTVIDELPESTRTGYTFLGWYTAQTGGTRVTAPLTVTANMVLHAQWRVNDYLVTYVEQGGTTVPTAWHTYNTAIGVLPTTTRTGYTFQGWFSASTGGTRVSETTIITNDVTYYAQWVINEYTITWDSNGGDTITSSKVKYNHEIGTLPGTNRVGHTLNGWYTTRAGGTMIVATTKVTANITYYARWTPVTYTVTFDVQGGSAVTAYGVVYNTTIGVLPVTTKSGHHFEGWFTAINGVGSKVTTSTRIYGPTTYYAYWIINRTVTFNSNGGTAPSPATKTIVHNRVVGTLPVVTRVGYTLNGWYTSRTGGTQVTTSTLVVDDVTYYAQWTALSYAINFDAQGGTTVASKAMAHDARLGVLPVTTRSGYHFEGWYTATNGSGTQVTDRTVVAGPATYYAYWIVNRVVTFDLNGGNTQSLNTKVVPHGKVIGDLPTATRVGHTFNGWFTTRTNGTKLATTTVISSDITYYAQWTPITYTVRFDPLGGVGVDDRRVDYNTVVGTLPHTARVGYVFRGWFTSITGGTEITERTRVMGATTYYARWDDHAELVFDQNGGRNGLLTMRVPVGSNMSQVLEQFKAHNFNVERLVHTSKVFSNIHILETSTLKSAMLTDTNSFLVTQDLVGTLQWSDIVLVDLTTGPEVNNRDFTTFNHNTAQGITGSRTLVESGKTIRQLTLDLSKTGVPIRLLGTNNGLEMDVEGYTITGFKHTTSTNYLDKNLNDSMVLSLWNTREQILSTLTNKGVPRLSLEAMLKRVELMVKFDTQGGLPVEDMMVYYGDKITTLPVATKQHHDFQGWFTEPLGKGTKLTTSKVFKESETYYAHWTPKNYTISFDSQGGSTVTNRVVMYNTKLGTLPTTTRVGYLFLGWYTQKSGEGTQVTSDTLINGNFTYYAHWTDTVQMSFTNNGVSIAPMNVKIGTTISGLRSLLQNRDDIMGLIQHDTQFFQNIEVTESITGKKSNVIGGDDTMVITNHITGNITWSPYVRYHLTTGPDVKNKPFDTYELEFGGGKAVIEAPVQSYTSGQFAGKTIHYLTVDTSKTGRPITNLGGLAKMNLGIEGYTLTGWKNLVTGDIYNGSLTDAISVEQFRGSEAVRTRLNGDYTRVGIEAQVKRISYTVDFNSQGGSTIPSQTVYHGTKLLDIVVPTRTKYVFKGWFTQANGKGEQLTLDTVIKTNRLYYAHWNEILNIKFETQGGSGPIAERNFEKGNTVGTLPLTTLTKHRFVGWFTQQDGKGERVTATRVPQGDETYFAYWREQMTVRFMNLQTQVGVQTVDVGTKLPSLPTVTREGHTFIGWLIDGTDSYLTKDTLIMGDMVAVAHFTRNITVKFDSQGGTAVVDLNMLSGDLLPAIPAPTKTDFNFNGWYTQPGGYGASFRPGVPVYDDITLYAHWTDNEYRVTFDTMGGTPTTSILVIKGASIGLDGRTQRTGYRFVGWYTEPSYINKVPSLYTPTKSVTLYAKWELIKIHEVSFNTNSDIVLPSLYVTENTSIEKLPSPTRDGYGFLGWYLDASLTIQVYEGYMPIQDTILHAKWVKLAEIVNITFDSANGQAVRSYQAVKGQPLPSSYYTTPVREGYRFMGWYVGNQVVNNSTVYQGNTNIVAKWEVRGSFDNGKHPSDPSLMPNLTPRPWVPTPYLEPASKPVGEKTIEKIVTVDGIQVSEASDWLKTVTKVTLTTGREKQVIYGDE